VESTYLNRDMCKFESSQKDESRWQSTDSSKPYRNTSAFKCKNWSEANNIERIRENTFINISTESSASHLEIDSYDSVSIA